MPRTGSPPPDVAPHGRGDLGAAANLLGRAAALLPPESRERIEVVLALVEALAALMRVAEAETLLEQAGEAAELLGDERLTARVNVETGVARRSRRRPSGRSETWCSRGRAKPSRSSSGSATTSHWRARWRSSTIVHLYFGRLSEVAAASERGYRHAERAQNVKQQGKHRLGREAADQWGPTPFDRIDDLLEEDLAWARRTGSLGVEAIATVRLGVVRALRGDRVGGNELFARGMSACVELGARIWAFEEVGCWIWALTDDPGVAESRLRETYGVLADAGKRGMLSTVAAILAECLYRQGRYDEADDMLAEAAEMGAADDVVTQVYVRTGRAKLSARRGNLDEAEAVGPRRSRPRRRGGVRRPAWRLAARARRGAAARRPRTAKRPRRCGRRSRSGRRRETWSTRRGRARCSPGSDARRAWTAAPVPESIGVSRPEDER